MIIFGFSSGVSITQLFMGGIVPGILLATSLIFTWWFIMRNEKVEVMEEKPTREILNAFIDAIWALFLPVIIIVGLRFGVFTPTEAAAVATVYALIIGLFVYKELKIKDIYKVFVASAKSTSVVMFLVAAAMVGAWAITIANVPAALTSMLAPLINHPQILLLAIVGIVLLLGMVMDLTPLILILTPVVMPVVNMAGIDPVYFGIVFILAGCIGLLTPPVGTVMSVTASVAQIKVTDMLKGLWPFMLAEIVIVLLIIFFPSIVTIPVEWFIK
jgi:tripartite ATP-independent transporter DctM subunit